MESRKNVKARRITWGNWILLILFFVATPSLVHADISDILLKFHPYIIAQEEYSNNILLSPHGAKEADYITTVYPGLKISALTEQTYGIDLDFYGGYNYYAKHHDFNYWSVSGRVNTWYGVNPHLTFRFRDYLIRSDAGRETQYQNLYDAQARYIGNTQPDQYLLSTERGVHAIYLRNVVEPSVEFRFAEQSLLSVLYRNNVYRNQNIEFEDSMENTLNPVLAYWFDIRNSISLNYYLTLNTYQRSPDQLVNGITPRYTYRFNPRTSIFGEYHFEYQDFKSPGVDYYVHNASIGIEHKFSPTLTGLAQGGCFWQVVKRGPKAQAPSFNLSLIKRAERTLYTVSLQGGYTEDYITAQNLGFAETYSGYVTVQHQFTQRLSAVLTGSLGRYKYPVSDQKDWVWSVGGGPSFSLFRWLLLSLEASYRGDNSNISANDYTEFRAMFRVAVVQPGYQSGLIGQPTYR